MGIFDNAKDLASENSEAVGQGVDKAGDFADEKTGGQHSEQVDQGQEFLKDQVGGGQPEGEQPNP